MPKPHITRAQAIEVGTLRCLINGETLIVRGECGQTFHIPLADWNKLKKLVNKAIRAEAKRREMADKLRAGAFSLGQMVGRNPYAFPAAGMFDWEKKVDGEKDEKEK